MKVENFIGVKRAETEFEDGVYVLVGRNGSGKSSLFEAIHFALYGEVLRTNLQSAIRHGASKANVEFVFEIGSEEYRVIRRITRRRSSHEAVLYNSKRSISGAEKVNREIKQLLGGIDSKSFSKFFLIPQDRINSILSEPRDFRETVMKILAFDELKRKLKLFLGDRKRALNLDSTDSEIERLESAVSKEDGLKNALEELNERIEKVKKEKEKLHYERERISELLGDLKDLDLGKLKGEIERLEEMERLNERIRVARSIEPLLNVVESFRRNLMKKKAEIEKNEKEMKSLRKRLSHLEKEIEGISREIEKKSNQIEDLEKSMEDIERIVEMSVEIRGELSALEAERNNVSRALDERMKDLEEARIRFERLGQKFERLEKTEEDLKKFLSEEISNEVDWMAWKIATTLGEGSRCPVCGGTITGKPEHVDFDPERLEKIERELEKIEREKRSVESEMDNLKLKVSDLEEEVSRLESRKSELEKAISDLREELRRMGYEDGLQLKRDRLREKLETIESELESLREMKEELGMDRAKVEKSLENLEDAQKRLEAEVKELEKELGENEERLKERLDGSGMTAEDVRRYSRMEEKDTSDLESKRAKLSELERRIETLRAEGYEPEDLSKRLGELESRLSDLEAELAELLEKRGGVKSELEGVGKLKAELEDLKRRFERARREYRALDLIDTALRSDEFDEFIKEKFIDTVMGMANEKLSEMTEGRFEINLIGSKLSVKKDGVLLNSGQLSGGERTIVSLSLAMAISEALIGNLGMLFIDEGFASLDEVNREKVAEMLRKLDVGDRVLVFITHHEDLKDKFERKLVMKDGVLQVG